MSFTIDLPRAQSLEAVEIRSKPEQAKLALHLSLEDGFSKANRSAVHFRRAPFPICASPPSRHSGSAAQGT